MSPSQSGDPVVKSSIFEVVEMKVRLDSKMRFFNKKEKKMHSKKKKSLKLLISQNSPSQKDDWLVAILQSQLLNVILVATHLPPFLQEGSHVTVEMKI